MVHIVLAVFLAVSRPGLRRGDGAPAEGAAEAEPEPEVPAPPEERSPPPQRQELQARIEASVERFAEQDREKLAERAESEARWLERHSSEQAIEQIGEVVREAYDTPPRAYAPVDPPPPGDFDHDTMLPYSVRQEAGADGSARVTYTWVDARGRSLEIEMAEEESDPALTAALKMAERSPMMRQLFQTSVLPVLEAQLRQKQ